MWLGRTSRTKSLKKCFFFVVVFSKLCFSMSGRHKQLSVSLGNLSKEYEDHVKRLFDQHRNLETEARKVKSVLENSVKKLERARDKARLNIVTIQVRVQSPSQVEVKSKSKSSYYLWLVRNALFGPFLYFHQKYYRQLILLHLQGVPKKHSRDFILNLV